MHLDFRLHVGSQTMFDISLYLLARFDESDIQAHLNCLVKFRSYMNKQSRCLHDNIIHLNVYIWTLLKNAKQHSNHSISCIIARAVLAFVLQQCILILYNAKASAVFFFYFSDVKKPALLLALYENTILVSYNPQ